MSQAHAGAGAGPPSGRGDVAFDEFDQHAWIRDNRPSNEKAFSYGPLAAIGDADPFDAAFAAFLHMETNSASDQGHATTAASLDTFARNLPNSDAAMKGISALEHNGSNMIQQVHNLDGLNNYIGASQHGSAASQALQYVCQQQPVYDGVGTTHITTNASGNVNTHTAPQYDNTEYGIPYSNFRPDPHSQVINDVVAQLATNPFQTGATGQMPTAVEAGGCAVTRGHPTYVQGWTSLQTASAFGQAQSSYQTHKEQLPVFHAIAPRQPIYQQQMDGAQMQTRGAVQEVRKVRPAFASPRAPLQRGGGKVAAPKQTHATSIDRVEDGAVVDTQNVNAAALEFYGYFTDEEKADIIKKRKQAKADAKEVTTGDERSNINNALRITVEGAPGTPLRIKSLEHAYLVVEQRMPLSKLAREGPPLRSMVTDKQKIVNFFVRCLNADIVPVPDDVIKFTAFGLQTYEDWEQSEKEKCWDVLDVQTEEDLYAQACCVILYHKTYDIYNHPRGLRMYDSKVIDEPDLALTWVDRVKAIGAALRKEKIVAHGVLEGNRIEEFVANPAEFAKRKVEYRWNNISRGANKTLIRKTPEQLKLDIEAAEVAAAMAANNSSNDAPGPLLAAAVSTQPQQAAGVMQTPATTVASSPSATSSSVDAKTMQKKRTAAEALRDDEEEVMDIEQGPPARRTRASKKAEQGLVQGPPPPAKMT
ncbi:hypothetical protein LTR95_008695 [Oleoguttula sp. CCFEE 5521]